MTIYIFCYITKKLVITSFLKHNKLFLKKSQIFALLKKKKKYKYLNNKYICVNFTYINLAF